jgi:hypothetical protein
MFNSAGIEEQGVLSCVRRPCGNDGRWHMAVASAARRARRECLAPVVCSALSRGELFHNFLPSNIGGDVIRISDTARRAHTKTLATTIVLVDRVLGLMGLIGCRENTEAPQDCDRTRFAVEGGKG